MQLVALSACSLFLHTSGGGPLTAEYGTSPPDCCIFKVSSVIVPATQVLDGFNSATRVASQSHLGVHLSRLVSIWKKTQTRRHCKKTPSSFFFEMQIFFFTQDLWFVFFFSYLQIHKTLIKLHLKIHYTSHYLC